MLVNLTGGQWPTLTLPSDAFGAFKADLPDATMFGLNWDDVLGDYDGEIVIESAPLPIRANVLEKGALYFGAVITDNVDHLDPDLPHSPSHMFASAGEANRSDQLSVSYTLPPIQWSVRTLAATNLYGPSIMQVLTAAAAKIGEGHVATTVQRSALDWWLSALDNLHYYGVIKPVIEHSGDMADQILQMGKMMQASGQIAAIFGVYGTPEFVSDWANVDLNI